VDAFDSSDFDNQAIERFNAAIARYQVEIGESLILNGLPKLSHDSWQ